MSSAEENHTLRDGNVARLGLLTEEQVRRAEEVIQQATDDGIETVRVVFADQHGILRGKTIVIDGLRSAFQNGVTVTSTLLLKDTSHRTVFPVWGNDIGFGIGTLTGAGDIMLVPDPDTFRMLPWSPHSSLILCDLYYNNGEPISFSTRGILRDAIARLDATGKQFICGLEVEFYVFNVDQPKLAHADGGMPATPPETSLLSHGYQYLTDARYDVLERVMDELRSSLSAARFTRAFDGSGIWTQPVRVHVRA